ncbi:universal stress protein [Antrihabitans sp. NCIMB 15449]|uniref:Universal stress protein n=1 Tax=Antrihabitans spumae TaxID=3373370 RepID=A0ABW7JQX5_9NOCA
MAHNAPIIVGVDGSPSSNEAVRWAAQEATRQHAPLLLVLADVIPLGYLPGNGFYQTEIDKQAMAGRATLAEAKLLAEGTASSVDVQTEFVTGSAIQTLLDRSKDARMLAVGSRGLGAFRSSLLGSVSTALAMHAHCPVAVIRDARVGATPDAGSVVVGIDGSATSVHAIGIAFDQASKRGVELVAVHAWMDTSQFALEGVDGQSAEDTEAAVFSESLAGWHDQYPDVGVRRVLVKDRPVRQLLEESATAQVLVVGSHGRGGFTGMLLGSTSRALLHTAECPIIVARISM